VDGGRSLNGKKDKGELTGRLALLSCKMDSLEKKGELWGSIEEDVASLQKSDDQKGLGSKMASSEPREGKIGPWTLLELKK